MSWYLCNIHRTLQTQNLMSLSWTHESVIQYAVSSISRMFSPSSVISDIRMFICAVADRHQTLERDVMSAHSFCVKLTTAFIIFIRVFWLSGVCLCITVPRKLVAVILVSRDIENVTCRCIQGIHRSFTKVIWHQVYKENIWGLVRKNEWINGVLGHNSALLRLYFRGPETTWVVRKNWARLKCWSVLWIQLCKF